MTPDSVLDVGRHALEFGLMLSAPLLLTALLVGVIVGLFQAATQINEMTLSFIPKLIAVSVAGVACGPWMLRLLVDYTRQLFENIPSMIG